MSPFSEKMCPVVNGVDWLCAVRELRQLRVEIDPQYVAQLEVTMEQRRLERQRRKQPREGSGIDMTFGYLK